MGDTILMRIMVMLFLMSLAVSAQESEEAPATPKGGDIYLRVANLLPLSMERVTILADGKAWLRGLKPGFFSGYQPLDKSGPDEFQVQLGSRRVGTAKLRQADDASYYTLVIIGSNSQPELVLRADNPLIEEKEPEEGKPPEPPTRAPLPKLLRCYFGGFEFPYQVAAQGTKTWTVDGEHVVDEVVLDASVPGSIQVTYTNRYEEKIEVSFPLDFSSSGQCSVFISQRSKDRPRVLAYSDNLKPLTEEVGNDVQIPSADAPVPQSPPASIITP
jgi:hypothetical protein